MPTLKDTEWRLLCVIVRQTLGWQEAGGARKGRDWLTHSQLKRRTGRSSEAICHALAALVQQGWVEVEDAAGTSLRLPEERRRAMGRLFFRLKPGLIRAMSETETEAGMSGRRPVELEAFPGGTPAPPMPESEIGQAKTTKETGNKIREGKRSPTVLASQGKNTLPKHRAKTWEQLVREEEQRFDVRHLLTAFQDRLWREAPNLPPPPILWKRDEPLAQELLAHYAFETLEERLRRFAALCKRDRRKCSFAAFYEFARADCRSPLSQCPSGTRPYPGTLVVPPTCT